MDRDRLHNQLVNLGDMMGDGLHHEPDGKWIEKEYSKIFNTLYPEVKKERRIAQSKKTNEQMENLLKLKKCSCGGDLKQSRSGSIIAYCQTCNMRYKAKKNSNQ